MPKVTIISGSIRRPDLQTDARTVCELRGAFNRALSIDPNSKAYVRGSVVSEDYKLKDGDEIEFRKETADKG